MEIYFVKQVTIIVIVQLLCPVVGRRLQSAVSRYACLALSSARRSLSSPRLLRLSIVTPVSL